MESTENSASCDMPSEKVIPTPFQKRTFWIAITALSIVAIGAVAIGMIYLGGTILSYLQPVLVPLAVAGIIAYLLEPIVAWLVSRGWKHNTAMLSVFSAFVVGIILLAIMVIVPAFGQAKEVYDNWGKYEDRIMTLAKKEVTLFQTKFGSLVESEQVEKGLDEIRAGASEIAPKIGRWFWDRLKGAFGFFGYLLGLLLVPIYLFYFLREGHKISETWTDYLPLRASSFKDEVVGTLKEVNGYLISFFRGQMVVSLIDGALVAVGLWALGLPYAVLIGVFLAILGLIPYIGNLLVMIPAVLIAIAHFSATEWGEVQGDAPAEVGKTATVKVVETTEGKPNKISILKKRAVVDVKEEGKRAEVLTNAYSWLPHVWVYPLAVLLIFLILQQINGLVTAPKIVGDSVGLHPLTVIFSVLFWSLILGGLLGALLAVPMTASIKVLFRRYIWERRLEPAVERRLSAGDTEDDSEEEDDDDGAEPALA